MEQPPQPQPQPHMERPPPPHVSPKGTWITKLIFRILSAVFSICIIGIAAGSFTTSYDSYDWYGWYAFPIIILGPPAGVGFVWDVAEAICIVARRGHRGIHPGAIVALDLLLWLGFVVGTVWIGLYSIYDYSADYYDYSYYGDYSSEISSARNLGLAVFALGVLEVIIHVILFIFGCYETSIRNRRPPIIMYSGAPPMMPMQPNAYGQQPMILPVGQAPPPGWVPYAYGPTPTQPQPVHQQDPKTTHEYYAPQPTGSVSPPPQEPSPIASNSTPVHDPRNSYVTPPNEAHHGTAH